MRVTNELDLTALFAGQSSGIGDTNYTVAIKPSITEQRETELGPQRASHQENEAKNRLNARGKSLSSEEFPLG